MQKCPVCSFYKFSLSANCDEGKADAFSIDGPLEFTLIFFFSSYIFNFGTHNNTKGGFSNETKVHFPFHPFILDFIVG
jgi:hypothetical protein